MDEPLSLSPELPPQTISMANANQDNYTLTPQAIDSRAFNISYGLEGTSLQKPRADVASVLEQGQELPLREATAASVNSDATANRNAVLTKTLADKVGPVTMDDLMAVDTLTGFNFPYQHPIAANQVFEIAYAKQYMREFDRFASKQGEDAAWTQAPMIIPDDHTAAQVFGDVATAQTQYLLTKSQDAEAKAKGQSYVGWGLDFAKLAFPIFNPYPELKMRGNIPGVGYTDGLMLGTNLEQQRLALAKLPFDQFTKTVDAIYGKMAADNPQAAQMWIGAMLGQSTTDKMLNNFNTVATGMDVAAIAMVGKVAFNKGTQAYQINNAVKTALKNVGTGDVSKADILASVGDMQAAGLSKANSVITGRLLGGAPAEEALRTLPNVMNAFADDIKASRLSQAHQNILLEQTKGSLDNTLRVLMETSRPVRVDLENVSEAVLKQIEDGLKRKYPGENNAVLDINKQLVGNSTFTTAKGSTYEVHPDGTTTRNKAARNEPGHEDDQGPKPTSDKTYFISSDAARALAPPAEGSFRIVDHGNGKISLSTKNKNGTWGIAPSAKEIPYSTTPSKGSTPLEVWGKEQIYNRDAYKTIHFGNEITEVGTSVNPNAVPGISHPIKDPISKTTSIRLAWGKDAGTLFSDYHEAADAAIQKGFRVTYAPQYLSELKSRIETVRAEIKAGPEMDADVGGLNYYHSLPDTLKTMEEKLAKVSQPGGIQIQPQGLGFYIEKFENVREIDKGIMNLVANPENPMAVSPNSWTKFIPWFNHFRTAEDTMSFEARGNRALAVTPQSQFIASLYEDGKFLADFRSGKIKYDPVTGEKNPFYKQGIPIVRNFMDKGREAEFQRTLDYSQNHFIDKETNLPGAYMNPDELHDFYMRTFSRPPSFDEVQSYEAVKRWEERQRIFTQVSVYRNQARLGNDTMTIHTKGVDGSTVKSPEFVGAIRTDIPRGKGTVLVMGDDLKSSTVKDMGKQTTKTKDEWQELVNNGTYRWIELYDRETQPFKGMGIKNGDTLIQYVLTKNVETAPLRWDTIPYRGGGRFAYEYERWIKQAKMKFELVDGVYKSNYMGDATVAAVHYTDLGEDVVKKMNVVRGLIKEGKAAEAKAAFVNNGLEGALEPWKDFRAKFSKTKNKDGSFNDPVFNVTEDFRVVPRNVSIADLDGTLANKYNEKSLDPKLQGSWVDATREGSPARNYQVDFTGQREAYDLHAINNVGTLENPVYQKTPAQKVDPLSMLNRGMQTTINSLFMDDYKIYGVNSFLKSVESNLKPEVARGMWSSPFGTFRKITEDSFRIGTPVEVKEAFMANYFKINQLIGTPSKTDTFVHSIAQNLADLAYRKLGPDKANLISPEWLMPKLRDPFAFIRSVTFNAYLGMFSPVQLLVQSMTYVNMFAISPKYASQATAGALLHGLTAFNDSEQILAHLDKFASKIGWKPGEWLEAREAMRNSGWNQVGGEYAAYDAMHRNNIIKSGTDKFMEYGRKPFQWGEQSTRIGSFFTAFREFRDANPTGRLSDTDIGQILRRANDFGGSMTTASHSMMNSGIFSVPTQFYMYSARLAELFWSGTRLGGTLAERNLARTRLVAVNAAMFGVPMAAGVTGAPVSDYIRQELLKNGYFGATPPYVVGQKFSESIVNEGIPAALLAAATGKWYNVGPRLGSGGVSPFKDLMEDAGVWKTVGGAAGSLTMNTINNGLVPLFSQVLRGDYSEVKTADILDVFNEVKSLSDTRSSLIALNTGKWTNKNSDYISDVEKGKIALMFLTGLRETQQSDMHNKKGITQENQDVQKDAMKRFTKDMNRSFIAAANNDYEQAAQYRRKAIAWLPASDFPSEKVGTAVARAIQGNTSLIDRINIDMYIRTALPKNQPQLRKAFQSIPSNRGK